MKIAIEAFALRNIKSGTGRYALDLISRISKEHDVLVITRNPDQAALDAMPKNVKVIKANNLSFIPTNIYLYLFLGHFLRRFRYDFSIFLIGCRPLFYKHVYDLVICDFNHKIFPKSVKFITRLIYRISSFWSINGCRNLISISDGTSLKSKEFYGRSADFIINPSIQKFKNIKPKPLIEVPKDFSIYVGAIEPRKNICNLLVAHEYARDIGLISDKLLLVSSQSWLEKGVNKLLSRMQHSHIISFIEEDELAWLYSNARRVYMTTFYEGYGMPAAEGRAFGAKVICTDIPELREACKNNGIFVGTSPIEIIEGIACSLAMEDSADKGDFNLSQDLFESQITKYLSQCSALRL